MMHGLFCCKEPINPTIGTPMVVFSWRKINSSIKTVRGIIKKKILKFVYRGVKSKNGRVLRISKNPLLYKSSENTGKIVRIYSFGTLKINQKILQQSGRERGISSRKTINLEKNSELCGILTCRILISCPPAHNSLEN